MIVPLCLTPEYIAGFVDGDGCIYLHSPRGCVNVRIVNECKEVIEAIHRQYGGSLSARVRSRRLQHDLCIASREAHQLLLDIEPHLVVKREQARIVLEHWESLAPRRVGGRPENARLPEETLQVRETVYWLLRGIKARGLIA